MYFAEMPKIVAFAGIIVTLIMPTTSNAAIDVDLRFGAKGDKVRELQEFLIARGYLSGEATGNFYGLTQKAVKAYQTSEKLPSTGFVGPMTRAAIVKMSAAAAPTSAAPILKTSATSDPVVGTLSVQVGDLLKQIEALRNQTIATSSLPQTYATDIKSFAFDQAWTNAVVNLYCMSRYGGLDDASSGSGVIIDPRGVILTNAHVAMDFLFSEWPNPSLLDCYVRIGSPAAPRYRAKLLYIPDEFVATNIAKTFQYNAEESMVYGKKDYALLIITGTSNPAGTLPDKFPYMPIYEGGVLPVNSPVYLSGYSAEFLGGEALQRSLYLLSSPTSVVVQQEIGSSTVPQAIGFSGNIGSQHGASGGAVITSGGKLAGMPTYLKKGYGLETSQRVLYAITTDYVMKDFAADNGTSLSSFIANTDLIGIANKFMADRGSRYQQTYNKMVKDKGYWIPGAN